MAMMATRPCQAIGQRQFGPTRGLLPVRRLSVRARVAATDLVAPAGDRGFVLKEVRGDTTSNVIYVSLLVHQRRVKVPPTCMQEC
jgi:hypothetical protein